MYSFLTGRRARRAVAALAAASALHRPPNSESRLIGSEIPRGHFGAGGPGIAGIASHFIRLLSVAGPVVPQPRAHRVACPARLRAVDAVRIHHGRADAAGWTKDPETLAGRFPHRLSASRPGTELRVPFTGDSVGLYWLVAPDSGDIEWSIDGGPWGQASSWDKYALHFTRANYALLADSLPPGPHELRVRVAPEKNPESTGTFVRIGAVLVNGAAR